MSRTNVPFDQLEQGLIRHAELPPGLVTRINAVRLALHEVYPSSTAEWLDDFRRDLHPEREIVWWERLTRCYLAYLEKRALSARQRKAAFMILLSIELGGSSDTLPPANLSSLPEHALTDLREILREHGL